MASPIANNFDGGTNNTTLTAGNTGGSSGTAISSLTTSGSTTIQFSDSYSKSGTLSMRNSYALSQAGYANWAFAPATLTTRTAIRFYFLIPSGQPTSSWEVLHVWTTSGRVMALTIGSTSRLVVRSASNTVLATAAATLTTDVWYRVEVGVAVGTTTSNGTIQVAYYVGDSGTPVETIWNSTATNSGLSAIANFRVGMAGLASTARTMHYDDFAAQELASGFIGPSVSGVHGDTASAITVAGAAAGHLDRHGVASTSATVARAASGTVQRHGAASASVTASGAASGTVAKRGVAASTINASGAAAGTRGKRGVAAQSLTASGAAAGKLGKHATATAVITDTGTATSVVGRRGTAPLTVSDTGAASGHRGGSSSTPSPLTITLEASGTVHHAAAVTAALDVEIVGAASGTVHRHGSAALVVDVAGASDGSLSGDGYTALVAHASLRWAVSADRVVLAGAATTKFTTDVRQRLYMAAASTRWEAHVDQD